MSGIHGTARTRGTAKGGAGGWRFTAAEWLHLAAAPTFMAMALLTGIAGSGAMDVLCASTHGMPLNAMATMYLLMGVFHSTPWLKLIQDRGNRIAPQDERTSICPRSRMLPVSQCKNGLRNS